MAMDRPGASPAVPAPALKTRCLDGRGRDAKGCPRLEAQGSATRLLAARVERPVPVLLTDIAVRVLGPYLDDHVIVVYVGGRNDLRDRR